MRRGRHRRGWRAAVLCEHLRTRAERAVYFTLVSQEAESWSAAEIADRRRLHKRDIEQIFEAYEASGIVAAIETTGGRRYRWRSDMNYLLGGVSESPDTVDPVCGMPVTEDSPFRANDPLHRHRRFCSLLCLAAFQTFHEMPAAQTKTTGPADAPPAR